MAAEEPNPMQPAELASAVEERLRDAAALLRRFKGGDYDCARAALGKGEGGAGELLRELQALGEKLAGERKVREERLSALAESVVRLASLNFTSKASVSHRNDMIDGL